MSTPPTTLPLYPPAPPHFSSRAAELWRELGPTWAATTARRALFMAGLEALDRCEDARLAVAAGGLMTGGSGRMQHLNPAVKVEAESRALFVEVWGQLGIVGTAPQDDEADAIDELVKEVLNGKRK